MGILTSERISYAYNHFLPIQKLYKEFHINIDNYTFEELPFLNKEILSQYDATNKFASGLKEIERLYTTSGTTAAPQFLGYTKRDWDSITTMLSESFKLTGVSENDVFYDLIPKTSILAGYIALDAIVKIGATIIPAGKLEEEKHVDIINAIMPTILNGLGFFIIKLGNLISTEAREKIRLIFLVGEFLTDETRNTVKTIYPNAEVFSGYGISEVFMGNECHEHNGFHYDPKNVFIEVINPDENGVGELVFTSLYSEAMPLIRYRCGDKGFIHTKKCTCGCSLPKFQVLGRMDKMVNIKGKLTSLELLKETIYKTEGIKHATCIYYVNDNSRFELHYTGSINEDELKQKIKKLFDVTPSMIKEKYNLETQWKTSFFITKE